MDTAKAAVVPWQRVAPDLHTGCEGCDDRYRRRVDPLRIHATAGGAWFCEACGPANGLAFCDGCQLWQPEHEVAEYYLEGSYCTACGQAKGLVRCVDCGRWSETVNAAASGEDYVCRTCVVMQNMRRCGGCGELVAGEKLHWSHPWRVECCHRCAKATGLRLCDGCESYAPALYTVDYCGLRGTELCEDCIESLAHEVRQAEEAVLIAREETELAKEEAAEAVDAAATA